MMRISDDDDAQSADVAPMSINDFNIFYVYSSTFQIKIYR